MEISEGIKKIGQEMILNPKDWVQSQYHFYNKKHPDIRFWTSNGTRFLQLQGNSSLNWRERIYITKTIKKSIANRLTT